MGYRGLLLNAPYKIDSLVWMRLMMISFGVIKSIPDKSSGLCEPKDILCKRGLK
jgi:hypothetical protein